MARASRQLDPEWVVAGVGALLAAIGWAVGASVVAAAGVMVALGSALFWVWGRSSLSGVRYTRVLSARRAEFGERVPIVLEVVNDKVLPLPWLEVRELVPPSLEIEGETVRASGWRTELRLVVSMLPYQRLRRQVVVVCRARGEHLFGPASLRSGSPIGTYECMQEVRNTTALLVYPKVAAISGELQVSRVPIVGRRALRSLATDTTNWIGVRPYSPGDPVRHVDWRGFARTGDLLVRVHEPSTAASVALFVDLNAPWGTTARMESEVTELVVSVTASLVRHLADARVPVGLFANGAVRGANVAVRPARVGDGTASLMDVLARVVPVRGRAMDRVLLEGALGLGAGVVVMVVAAGYGESTSGAMAELCRTRTLAALFVSTGHGAGPSASAAQERWVLPYEETWREREAFEVARFDGAS